MARVLLSSNQEIPNCGMTNKRLETPERSLVASIDLRPGKEDNLVERPRPERAGTRGLWEGYADPPTRKWRSGTTERRC